MKLSVKLLVKLADKYEKRLRELSKNDRSFYQNLFGDEEEEQEEEENLLFPEEEKEEIVPPALPIRKILPPHIKERIVKERKEREERIKERAKEIANEKDDTKDLLELLVILEQQLNSLNLKKIDRKSIDYAIELIRKRPRIRDYNNYGIEQALMHSPLREKLPIINKIINLL